MSIIYTLSYTYDPQVIEQFYQEKMELSMNEAVNEAWELSAWLLIKFLGKWCVYVYYNKRITNIQYQYTCILHCLTNKSYIMLLLLYSVVYILHTIHTNNNMF